MYNNNNNDVRKKPCPYCGSKQHYTKDCPKIDTQFKDCHSMKPLYIVHDNFKKINGCILNWKGIKYLYQFDINTLNLLNNMINSNEQNMKYYLTKEASHIILRYGKFNNQIQKININNIIKYN